MSDRSHANVTIYAIADPQHYSAVWEVLRTNDLDIEYVPMGLDLANDQVGLRLGLEYVHNEMVTGSLGQVAADLSALGATFTAHQDHTCGGGSGDLYRHTPELGLHIAPSLDCEPVIAGHRVAQLVSGTSDRDGLLRALEQRLGAAWDIALDAAREAVSPDVEFSEIYGCAGPVSFPLPLCAECGATATDACPGH